MELGLDAFCELCLGQPDRGNPPPVRLLSINTEASPTGNSHFHHKETTLIAYLCMFRHFFYVVCRGSCLER